MDTVDVGHSHRMCLTLGGFQGWGSPCPPHQHPPSSWGQRAPVPPCQAVPQHRQRWSSLLLPDRLSNDTAIWFMFQSSNLPLPSTRGKVQGMVFPQSPGGSLRFSGCEISPQAPHGGDKPASPARPWEGAGTRAAPLAAAVLPQPSRSIFLSPQGAFCPKEQLLVWLRRGRR